MYEMVESCRYWHCSLDLPTRRLQVAERMQIINRIMQKYANRCRKSPCNKIFWHTRYTLTFSKWDHFSQVTLWVTSVHTGPEGWWHLCVLNGTWSNSQLKGAIWKACDSFDDSTRKSDFATVDASFLGAWGRHTWFEYFWVKSMLHLIGTNKDDWSMIGE